MKQLFIGLDVHKKTWAATLQEGQLIVKRFTIEADADILTSYIAKHYPKPLCVHRKTTAAALVF